jgi:SAM-dependent methyltransferase
VFRRALYERVELTLGAFQDLHDFSVLDVGCGSGRNSIVFAKAGARRVVGIDFAENMISLAQRYKRSHGVETKCDFIKADALSYQFQEEFDCVVALGVFDYIADPRELLRRMIELSTHTVVGSFPRPSLLRAPLRKLRYSFRKCPVYFFGKRRLEGICREVGLQDFKLLPCGGAGYVLVGNVKRYDS